MHFFGINGHRIDNQWSAYGQAGVQPDGTDYFLTILQPGHLFSDPTLYPFQFASYFVNMACPPTGPCYGNFISQDPPEVDLNDDTWYNIMVKVKLNDI